MSEFQQAAKLWTGGLGIHVIHNPARTYSFVGSVPVGLSHVQIDGTDITDEQAQAVARHGAGLYRKTIQTRVFATREQAVQFAESRGYEVSK